MLSRNEAGSSTLFPWGSTLPEAAVLDRWMEWSLTEENIERNALGFGGLFFAEWCSDEFRVSHDPDAAIEPGAYVIKGGAVQFWPWQYQEGYSKPQASEKKNSPRAASYASR